MNVSTYLILRGFVGRDKYLIHAGPVFLAGYTEQCLQPKALVD